MVNSPVTLFLCCAVFSGIIGRIMWDIFSHFFARVLTWAWFLGAGLMILTIPACIYKIFSALWEDDSPEEEGIYDRPRKA